MKILVILAHPSAQSFNHAIASSVCRKLTELKHEIIFHDLYAENFNPLLGPDEILKDDIVDDTIRKHCEDLVIADGIVIIHPDWWGMPPAILKGWIDRVIRPGIAYEFQEGDNGEGIPVGLLNAKTALVFNTSNTSKEREENIFLDPLETIWKNCVFYLCGVRVFYRKMFRIVVTSSEKQRKQWLSETELDINKYFGRLAEL